MPLREALTEVRDRVSRDEPFEHIEAFIEDAPDLSDDERAMLWFYAWLGGEPCSVRHDLQLGVGRL